MTRVDLGGIASLAGKVWVQFRWQLIVSYLLGTAVSVLVVVVLALAVGDMLLRRASVHLVERQLDLMVEAVGAATQQRVTALMDLAPCCGGPPETRGPAETPFPVYPATDTLVECSALPTGAPGSAPSEEYPLWLRKDRFHGVVHRNGRPEIVALARRSASDCRIALLTRVPLDDELARLIAATSGMEVRSPFSGPRFRDRKSLQLASGVEPGGLGASPPSDGTARLPVTTGELSDEPSRADPNPDESWRPVIVDARDWLSGEPQSTMVLQAKPNPMVTLRQWAQFGRRQDRWLEVFGLLAASLGMVGIGSLLVAAIIADRIIHAISELTKGALEVGQGHLSHRIPVRTRDELGVLAETFNHMAGSLEQMLQEAKEKERLEQEVRVARDVQQSLYPQYLPRLPRTGLAAICEPARVVTGDLYDFIEVGNGRLGLLCADVSGKGVPAALLGANLQAVVRRCVGPACWGFPDGPCLIPSPSGLVDQINSALCVQAPEGRFSTLIWADYDSTTGLLRYTNAGHNPPILVLPGSGDVVRLDVGGVPVGLFAGASYAHAEIDLPPGSLLMLYTDGVSEAEDSHGHQFGDQRLVEICQTHAEASPEVLTAMVFDALRAWSGDLEPSDDMTVVVMKTLEADG